MDSDKWKGSTIAILNDKPTRTYKQCPNCSSTLLTEAYLSRYGQCFGCYKRNGGN